MATLVDPAASIVDVMAPITVSPLRSCWKLDSSDWTYQLSGPTMLVCPVKPALLSVVQHLELSGAAVFQTHLIAATLCSAPIGAHAPDWPARMAPPAIVRTWPDPGCPPVGTR